MNEHEVKKSLELSNDHLVGNIRKTLSRIKETEKLKNKITFCINTSNNEKEYVQLLMMSLLNGIDVNFHDIIIFIDSDNQNTTEMLVAQKSLFPNLRIIKNTGEPVGYSSNINWMFKNAKTDIVSYLQSDQVVCLNYDENILGEMRFKSHNCVISSTRIEPPLHAQYDNEITLVQHFGLIPSEFKYEEFLEYAENMKGGYNNSQYFFAPFTCYKKTWNKIGGFDVSFKKSREDSDMALRLALEGSELCQSWKALVYHFSCISSRMPGWYLPENQEKDIIRQQNDQIELDRYIKKWGYFSHVRNKYDDLKPYFNANPDLFKYNPRIEQMSEELRDKVFIQNPPIDESKFIEL